MKNNPLYEKMRNGEKVLGAFFNLNCVPGVEILAYIGADEYHAANDIQGKTVFELPPESEVYRGTREILEKFEIL